MKVNINYNENNLATMARVSDFGFRSNIWKINNGYGYSSKDDIAFEHPAIFPEKLAYDHIRTWSNENDLVYDPFMGSGTTAKACVCTNRNWIGSELNKKYCNIIEKRLQPLRHNLFNTDSNLWGELST